MKGCEKMFSIIDEIRRIRKDGKMNIDATNTNRYSIVLKERDGTNTAYCFTSPIYNAKTKQLVRGTFSRQDNAYTFHGSNSTTTVYKSLITIKNEKFSLSVRLGCGALRYQDGVMVGEYVSVIPSLNGITVIADTPAFTFSVEAITKDGFVRKNSKYFAFMKEGFRPYFSVSPICSFDKSNVYPATIKENESGNAHTYSVTAHGGSQVVFEINLYEPKLFSDTTVESAAPKENNAFGASAFIGKTNAFGEQWLYSRPDLPKIADLKTAEIKKALLHIPYFSKDPHELSVYVPKMRFCSFGSTWNNKKPSSSQKTKTTADDGYITLDLTGIISSKFDSRLKYSEGIILKNENSTENCVALATADNYSAPQILELRYKPL